MLTYILHFFALCRGPKGGGHDTLPPSPKYAPGCACLNDHKILVTKCFQKVWFVNTVFFFFLFIIKYTSIFRLVLRCLLVARKENLTG